MDIPSNREIRLSVTFTSKERREAGAEGAAGRRAGLLLSAAAPSMHLKKIAAPQNDPPGRSILQKIKVR